MTMNPYSKINELQKRVHELVGSKNKIYFSDGTVIHMTNSRIGKMFDSVINDNEPNEDALIFLNKLKKGIEDNNGLCHLVKAYSVDPKELWGDYY